MTPRYEYCPGTGLPPGSVTKLWQVGQVGTPRSGTCSICMHQGQINNSGNIMPHKDIRIGA